MESSEVSSCAFGKSPENNKSSSNDVHSRLHNYRHQYKKLIKKAEETNFLLKYEQ